MKFKEFSYERPDIIGLKKDFQKLIKSLKDSESLEAQVSLIKHINILRNEIDTVYSLCYIRHSIDTKDKFYEEEQKYFDQVMPIYEGIISDYYKVLCDSKFKVELEKEFGKQLFNIAKCHVNTFSEDIISDLQEENRLVSEYTKVLAGARIEFQGKVLNLAGLTPFQIDKDREVRKKASEAKYSFFEDKEEVLDEIFDALVKVRTKIAKKLGFNNFVDLAYARLCRTDYGPLMVKNFRDQVKKYIVPVCDSLYERQRKRLGLDSLKYYDENFKFLSGNATPKGDAKWILERGSEMYSDLSKKTKEFFDFLMDNELMDVINRDGKASGGYCTYIPNYRSPFIFSNFNGTSGDIDVLTHEAGHAFQVYLSRDYSVPEYYFPTLEACEIHSMSMEFFTWPWMELFFKEDTEKYKYSHLSKALEFIPYGVAVDEFQHFVYENPETSKEERKKAFRDIEKKYLPHRDYDSNEFLEKGTYWYQQRHIFQSPFYYIDYTLAQICALQFFKKSLRDRERAWEEYLDLCKEGGSKSFLKLLRICHLNSPFQPGTIEKVVTKARSILDGIDDSKL